MKVGNCVQRQVEPEVTKLLSGQRASGGSVLMCDGRTGGGGGDAAENRQRNLKDPFPIFRNVFFHLGSLGRVCSIGYPVESSIFSSLFAASLKKNAQF